LDYVFEQFGNFNVVVSGLCYGSSVCFLEGHPGVGSVLDSRFFLGSLEVLILLCGCRNISAVAAGDM